MSEKSDELLTKILRAVPERSRDDLEKIVGENFVKLGDININDFQEKKTNVLMTNDFPMIVKKDETHQMMIQMEPRLIALGYRTLRNILLTHGEYPCKCEAQTFCYPMRANLVLECYFPWDCLIMPRMCRFWWLVPG